MSYLFLAISAWLEWLPSEAETVGQKIGIHWCLLALGLLWKAAPEAPTPVAVLYDRTCMRQENFFLGEYAKRKKSVKK